MKPYTPKKSIKLWAKEDRPIEKLISHGKSTLTPVELVAILLGSGSKSHSAIELSQEVLDSVSNDLHQLASLNRDELIRFKGLGEVKAIRLIAAFELGRRRRELKSIQLIKITSSLEAFQVIAPVLFDKVIEEFWVVFLNQGNRVIGKERISIGGISGTVADIRIILKHSINKLASSIILFHNHPSGNVTPSMADKQLTKKVYQAAELMQVKVLDHIIISQDVYFSFADEGILN